MKKIITSSIFLVMSILGFAQKNSTDTIPKVEKDTIQIGGVTVIVKKKDKGKAKSVDIDVDNDKDNNNAKNDKYKKYLKRKKSNVQTNLFSIDIGFNNYTDNTNYASVGSYLQAAGTQPKPTASNFTLRTGKSVGVNLWLVKQKVNILRGKEHLGLKYALGIEHVNYRYNSPISFKNGSPSYVIKDSVGFSKNKLGINYLTVPLMLYINPDGKNGFSLSGGISAGYRINSFNKQRSDARGKDKNRGEYELNPFKLAVVGDIGYKAIRIYGSYNLTNLFDDGTKMDFTPYTIGFRLSKW